MTEHRFVRQQSRGGPVPRKIRFWQALGSWPDTFKNIAFNTFLLFYYSQLLGLPARYASFALAIALIIDAITDPMVGSYSDNLKSKMGRRHPLMFASIIPLGISLYCLFIPPAEMTDWQLFGWLLGFTISVRVALTFFVVPWNALFYEFTDDYEERTEILTWRWAIGWIGGLSFVLLTWTFIFPATEEFTYGQFNVEAYPLYGAVLALVVMFAAFTTTFMTRKEVPYLFTDKKPEGFSVLNAGREVVLACKNRNFLILFGGILIGLAVAGTNEALNLYMNTYFWGLTTEDLRWFGFAIGGAILAFALVPFLQRKFDKKVILLATIIILWVNGMMVVGARLVGILPENGGDFLLTLLVVNATFRASAVTAMGIIFGSMIADILDEQQLQTGKRQEGVFSAALAFSGKLSTAIGVMIGGLVLDFFISIPQGTSPEDASPTSVVTLGLIDAFIVPFFLLPVLWLISRYTLTRQRHEEIRLQLAQLKPDESGE